LDLAGSTGRGFEGFDEGRVVNLVGLEFDGGVLERLKSGDFEVKMNRDIILLKLTNFYPKSSNSVLWLFYHTQLNTFQTRKFSSSAQLFLYGSKVLVIGQRSTEPKNPNRFQIWSISQPVFKFKSDTSSVPVSIDVEFDPEFTTPVELNSIIVERIEDIPDKSKGYITEISQLAHSKSSKLVTSAVEGQSTTIYLKHGVDFIGTNLNREELII
jgi:hypothetical protein